MNIKQLLQNTILISWCFVGCYFIIFGSHGFVDYAKMHLQREKSQQRIAELDQAIITLKQKIAATQSDSFYHEQKARYDFCMGYTNEIVYIQKKEPAC